MRYRDGSRVESPQYGRIDRSRPFEFWVYSTALDLLPLLRIPVLSGERLVYRKRHDTRPGTRDRTLVAVESEDRSHVTVWVFALDEPTMWRRLNGYTEEFYLPELLDFETVVGERVSA